MVFYSLEMLFTEEHLHHQSSYIAESARRAVELGLLRSIKIHEDVLKFDSDAQLVKVLIHCHQVGAVNCHGANSELQRFCIFDSEQVRGVERESEQVIEYYFVKVFTKESDHRTDFVADDDLQAVDRGFSYGKRFHTDLGLPISRLIVGVQSVGGMNFAGDIVGSPSRIIYDSNDLDTSIIESHPDFLD